MRPAPAQQRARPAQPQGAAGARRPGRARRAGRGDVRLLGGRPRRRALPQDQPRSPGRPGAGPAPEPGGPRRRRGRRRAAPGLRLDHLDGRARPRWRPLRRAPHLAGAAGVRRLPRAQVAHGARLPRRGPPGGHRRLPRRLPGPRRPAGRDLGPAGRHLPRHGPSPPRRLGAGRGRPRRGPRGRHPGDHGRAAAPGPAGRRQPPPAGAADAGRRPLPRAPPAPPVDAATAIQLADAAEAAVEGTAQRPSLSREIVDLVVHGLPLSCALAESRLGLSWTPLSTTLDDFDAWARRLGIVPPHPETAPCSPPPTRTASTGSSPS